MFQNFSGVSPARACLRHRQNHALVTTFGSKRIKAAGSSPATKSTKSNPDYRDKINIVSNILQQQNIILIQSTSARVNR